MKTHLRPGRCAGEKSFATDWLVDRSLEILERDKNKPFV